MKRTRVQRWSISLFVLMMRWALCCQAHFAVAAFEAGMAAWAWSEGDARWLVVHLYGTVQFAGLGIMTWWLRRKMGTGKWRR